MHRLIRPLIALFLALHSTGRLAAQLPAPVTPAKAGRPLNPLTGNLFPPAATLTEDDKIEVAGDAARITIFVLASVGRKKASPTFHQLSQGSLHPETREISCRQTNPENRAWKKRLWDGYEVSLGPTPPAAERADQGCTAAIYNQAGHVVFRTTGFNVIFDENHTGEDFDNDGKPEVVFKTDLGGGNHCCWAYLVVSLSPKPHKLFSIDAPGAVDFEKDNQGRMVIWQQNAGTHEFTSEARTPLAEKVLRVHEGELVDVTPEFCWRIFSDPNEDQRAWKGDLAPEKIKILQSTADMGGENEQIVSDLLSRALQNVFCRRFDAAQNDLNLWPEATRAKMKAAFADSIKEDYPEFAARLTAPGGMAPPARNLPRKIAWLKDLSASETFLAADLTLAERKQIIDQVEKTSFDFPSAWESELRVRRVSLGDMEGLLIRGTQLLCGGTGNCETWVFRRHQRSWVNMFEQEAPSASGFGFDEDATHGIKNFLVSASSSAEKEGQLLFRFDGKFYRQSECWDVSVNEAGAEKFESVPCK